ncbi:hypothetical protein IAU59_007174 [Kwoniella sp. CBS 9459]
MTIFGSMPMFRSGRSTCTHPFAEGADPLTPLTASTGIHDAGLTACPRRTDPLLAQEPSSGRTARLPVAAQYPIATPVKKTTATTTPTSRTPPSTWSSANSTPISALPPTLPPPSYGLPPTPEASPQQGPRSALEGGTKPLHIRKPSVRTLSKPLPAAPSAPPTCFAPPSKSSPSSKHPRTTSGPSLTRSVPAQRFRSGSASTAASESATSPFTVDSKHGMRDRFPAPSNDHDCSATFAAATVNLWADATVSVGHADKHRPAALKLCTSNLSDSSKGDSARNRHRRLPTIDLESEEKEMVLDSELRQKASSDAQARKPSPPTTESVQALGTGCSLFTPGQPSVARLESDTTIKASNATRSERRRSMSTGDVLNISQLEKLRNPEDTPRKRREGPLHDHVNSSRTSLISPTPCSHTPKSASTAPSSRTPASAWTGLPDLEAAIPLASTGTAKPFDNLPLPWSTVEASTLQQELGQQAVDSLMEFTLSQLLSLPPRLLRPSILRTSASEEGRLRSELARLKEKYHALLSHRDALAKRIEQSIVKADQAKVHKMVQALGQTSRKCDRVARQVYICNDQIRQIEIQAEEHVVGALRLALRKKEEDIERMKAGSARSPGRDTRMDEGEVEEECDYQSSGPQASPASPNSPCDVADPSKRRLPSSGPIVRFIQPSSDAIRSPTSPTYRESMRVPFCGSPGAPRPISTATIININTLSFPLPPDRIRHESHPSSSSAEWSASSSSSHTSQNLDADTEKGSEAGTDIESEAPSSYGGLEVQIEPEGDDEGSLNPHGFDDESSDSHRTATISILGGHEIVIYPPGHGRSLSAPSCSIGVDLPYTPASWGHEHRYPPTPTTSEPLRLKVPILLPSRSSSLAWHEGGQPIRRQTRSMNIKSGQEGLNRTKVVRDSMLETSESILLSLATAPLWAKDRMTDDRYRPTISTSGG